MAQVQMIAGSVAGFIFSAASWNMLVKAWRTKDLSSYSLGQIVLNNVGNLFYWLYVLSLPLGPVYFMHGFFTLASLLMLVWYLLYQKAPEKAFNRKGTQRSAKEETYKGAAHTYVE